MKKYLILCYEEGRNPFPIKEETKRTKKTRKEIFLQYRKFFDIVKVFEIDWRKATPTGAGVKSPQKPTARRDKDGQKIKKEV